jgi:hypothetical protein
LQHKAALEAEEHARQQELLKQQQAERRNFVEGKSIVNRINVALQMPPVSANKPITPKK